MNISFENPDKINGLLTIVVEESDYKADVEKTLKDYRKRANVPGFRPGQVPMGMVKRQYGTAVKVDVVNKFLGEQLQKYVVDNKIKMLGQPLAKEGGEPVDLEKPAPYTFEFACRSSRCRQRCCRIAHAPSRCRRCRGRSFGHGRYKPTRCRSCYRWQTGGS